MSGVAIWDDFMADAEDARQIEAWNNGGREALHRHLDKVEAARKAESTDRAAAQSSFAWPVTSLRTVVSVAQVG